MEKVKFIILLLFLFPVLVIAQDDPDSLYDMGINNYNLENYEEAITYFLKAYELEEQHADRRTDRLARSLIWTAHSYYSLQKYSDALPNYRQVLRLYYALSDSVNITNTLYYLSSTHLGIQQLDQQVNTVPEVSLKTESRYFRLGSIDNIWEDSMLVTIQGGTNDGLYKGSNGVLYGYSRTNIVIGEITVREPGFNYSEAIVLFEHPLDTMAVLEYDLAYLPARVGQKYYHSRIDEIAGFDIEFQGNDNEVLYHPRLTAFNVDSRMDYYLHQVAVSLHPHWPVQACHIAA